MSAYGGNWIVDDGLVFHIDARNPKSYVTGSTEIYSLVGNMSASFRNGYPDFINGNGYWTINNTNNYAVLRREEPGDLVFSNSDYTIEFWVSPASVSNFHYIPISIWNTGGSPGTNEFAFSLASSVPTFTIETSDTSFVFVQGSTTISIGTNSWYCITGIRNNTTMSLYVNGVIDGTPIMTGSLSGSTNTVSPLYIGAFRNNQAIPDANASAVFYGDVAILRIYNRALTADEIKHNYDAQKTRFGL